MDESSDWNLLPSWQRSAFRWLLGAESLIFVLGTAGSVRAVIIAAVAVGIPLAAVGLLILEGLDQIYRRRQAGQCIRCGYDVRATPDRCPECGTSNSPIP